MRVFRARSSGFTSIALAWQLLAVIFVPTALCCRDGRDRAPGAAAPAAAAECPMHHEDAAAPEPSCPLHTHAPPTPVREPRCTEQAVIIAVPSTNGLAPAPAAPPPRT